MRVLHGNKEGPAAEAAEQALLDEMRRAVSCLDQIGVTKPMPDFDFASYKTKTGWSWKEKRAVADSIFDRAKRVFESESRERWLDSAEVLRLAYRIAQTAGSGSLDKTASRFMRLLEMNQSGMLSGEPAALPGDIGYASLCRKLGLLSLRKRSMGEAEILILNHKLRNLKP